MVRHRSAGNVLGSGVPTLIAVHPENDPEGKGYEQAKAYAAATGGDRAGVLESSFVAEVKSDLMGEQTILCGMLQTGAVLCFDKMIEKGKIRRGSTLLRVPRSVPFRTPPTHTHTAAHMHQVHAVQTIQTPSPTPNPASALSPQALTHAGGVLPNAVEQRGLHGVVALAPSSDRCLLPRPAPAIPFF